MAVRIRLSRVGATKRPSYRVVAIDGRKPRDGRSLEILGYYDPLTDPATVKLEADRIRAWIGKGAQPSDTVVKLLRRAADIHTKEPAISTRRQRRRKHVLICGHAPPANTSRCASSELGNATDITS